MKIVVCGTGPFAVPSLKALLVSGHTIAALVTRPIGEAGQRRKMAANPMRDAGIAAGLTIFDPPDINAPEFLGTLSSLQPDLLMVCDYGQILSRECLSQARKGGINLHGSLLPRYRGAAPVAWAIWRGETVTGVSVIHMTGQLDGGPILASASLEIGAGESCAALEPRLAELGVQPVLLAIRQLDQWDGSSAIGLPQDPALATRARRLRKEDAAIRWERSAVRVHNQIRALQPWPGTYTLWSRPGSTEPLRLIVHRAKVASESAGAGSTPESASPGTVVRADGERLIVQCGKGCLELFDLQPAGKRMLSIADFLRGYQVRSGDCFQ